jgi:hypothetical protein
MKKFRLIVIAALVTMFLMTLAIDMRVPSSHVFSALGTLRSGNLSNPKERYVNNNVIISDDMPPIRIKVNKVFKHVGNIQFNLKEIAQVERVIFVDADKRRVKRMFIVQFEGFLEGVNDYYKYSLKNPITLGRNTYGSNAWFYDNAEHIRENPGAEPDRTTAFLKAKGYHHEDKLMMARFVRPVGEAKRHEIIIFYFENLSDAGFTPADFDNDGKALESKRVLEKAFMERALKSFSISD